MNSESDPREFDGSPIHRFLGLELLERDSAGAVVRLPVRDELLQEEGVVQGGVLSALADASAVFILFPDLPPDRTMTSVEFKVNFLNPARPERGDLVARSRLIRRGRTLAVCSAEVHQAESQVLHGLFTYIFSDR